MTIQQVDGSSILDASISNSDLAAGAAAANLGYTPVAPSAYASVNGLTITSMKILGRTTAGTGPAEEITIGSGLSFSAGVLSNPTSGTVTTVSVTSVNGMTGTVSNASSTPAISIGTSLTGLIKGNGTGFSVATAGTDYATPAQSFYIGTTAVTINRASGALALTGVAIDGSSGSANGLTSASGIVAVSSATAPLLGQVLTALNGTSASWQYSNSWVLKTTTYAAVAGDNIFANTTSAAFTITLPATPATNAAVNIVDYAGTFASNNLTIARNGSKIMGLSEDMTISVKNVSFTLVYIDSTQGWKIT